MLNLFFDNSKFIVFFSLFLGILAFSILVSKSDYSVYPQNENENENNTSSSVWISERNNLNISLRFLPEVPIIDQKTKILFEIRKLNDSTAVEGLRAKVTLTDHDGRLYKFENKVIPAINGKFSTEYIFPDDGQHRIILQLYNNTSAFTISSFDVFINHSMQQQVPGANKNFFSQLFGNFLN